MSCLKKDIIELETSNKGFKNQLQQQRDEIAQITVWLKIEINSGKN